MNITLLSNSKTINTLFEIYEENEDMCDNIYPWWGKTVSIKNIKLLELNAIGRVFECPFIAFILSTKHDIHVSTLIYFEKSMLPSYVIEFDSEDDYIKFIMLFGQ